MEVEVPINRHHDQGEVVTLSEEMLYIHISNASVDWGTLVDCSDSELVVRSMTDIQYKSRGQRSG